METYIHEEKYRFLVVQAFNKQCYGFDITHADEHAKAVQIILDKNNFIASGQKVARKLPNWIHNNLEWDEFLNKKFHNDSQCKNADNKDDTSDNNDDGDGKENDVESNGNDVDDDNSSGEEEGDNDNEPVHKSNDEEDMKVKCENVEDTLNSISGGDLKKKMFEHVAEPFKS